VGSRGKVERQRRRYARHPVVPGNRWLFSLTDTQLEHYKSMLSLRISEYEKFRNSEKYTELARSRDEGDMQRLHEIGNSHSQAQYIFETIEDKQAGLYKK
jgi:hypothetical protein